MTNRGWPYSTAAPASRFPVRPMASVARAGSWYAWLGGYDSGTDTLYANWSDATAAITWVNTPATDTVVNGVTVKEVERMLVSTGSGNARDLVVLRQAVEQAVKRLEEQGADGRQAQHQGDDDAA